MTITNSQILTNVADFSEGGGVYNGGDAWLFTSAIGHNKGRRGAGVSNEGKIVLDRCAVYQNGYIVVGTWGVGGGLENSGTALLTNCTVSNNQSSGGQGFFGLPNGADGGGIFNTGNLLLENTTVANNQTGKGTCGGSGCRPGGSGGGLANDGGAVTIHNSLIAQNGVADGGSGPDCTGIVTSQGPNFIGDPTGCTLGGASDDILNRHAFLGPLTDNGGPTPTHALLPYSPALDTGSCTALDGAPLLTDQRGEPRPQGADCDLGAFESALSTLPLPEILHLPLIRIRQN